jgi:hypothetical protein
MADGVPFCFFRMGDDDGSGDRVWDIPFLPPLRVEDLGGMVVSEKLMKL